MASKFIEHPFDLAKVRLQSQVLSEPGAHRFAGPADCLRYTWRNEGFLGLYRVRTLFPLLSSRGLRWLHCRLSLVRAC
jgi:hypothetical protein